MGGWGAGVVYLGASRVGAASRPARGRPPPPPSAVVRLAGSSRPSPLPSPLPPAPNAQRAPSPQFFPDVYNAQHSGEAADTDPYCHYK